MTAATQVRETVDIRSPAESYNLLRSLDELGDVLLQTLRGGFGFDAFLVAAGMHQILADELHPDPFRLDEAGQVLGSRALGWCARWVQLARQLFLDRALVRCERELAALVEELAGGTVELERAERVVETIPDRVRSRVLRLPACFHDFDQRPEDLERLVRDFAVRYPDRSRRLVIVGVRTSGSYLAPLQAAYLRAEGFERVDVLTVRPGRRLLRAERRVVGRDALVLVVDDPPGTGRSLERAIRALRVPASSVVLLLQLFENQQLPPAVSQYAAVCLPWREWSVHRSLPGEPLPAGRGHARALGRSGLAVGSGIGYFGWAATEIARALPFFVPPVEVDGGVLRREWLPDDGREEDPERIGEYVAARAAALPVREDYSLRMAGEFPVWEVASNLLGRVFGRAGPLVKLIGLDAAARRLLCIERPSLVDGWTDGRQWFAPGRKVGFHERSFWHLGMACFDPVYDLAVAAAGRDHEFVAALERGYGEAVDPERFLLYELAVLSCRKRLHSDDVRRASSAAVRRYMAHRFLADAAVADGPVVALDLDGVLETEHLGFPATTRSGALALRALIRHGYRPVPASGRSAGEVAERCADYGLPGGVAEYGGAIVVDGDIRSLLTAEMEAALGQAEGDPGYRHSIRIYDTRAQELDGLRAIRGEGQTDFVPSGIDKASGLRALLAELGAERLAFAVGDTAADLPMLELADAAAVPGHSRLRRGRVRQPYQAGLAQAVGRLIGHAPGSCPVCRVELDERAELLLAILSAQERGPLGIVRTALRLRRAG